MAEPLPVEPEAALKPFDNQPVTVRTVVSPKAKTFDSYLGGDIKRERLTYLESDDFVFWKP